MNIKDKLVESLSQKINSHNTIILNKSEDLALKRIQTILSGWVTYEVERSIGIEFIFKVKENS